MDTAIRVPSGKIVEVPSERISYFKADIESVMGRLASPVVRGRKSKPVSLVEDVLWALGEVEIGSGGRTASLWFARRLHDNAEWEKVQRTIRDRPAPHLRIVLTTTAAHRFGNALFQNHLIVPLVDILRHGSGLTIDRSILLSRVRNPYGSNSSLIQHSADYAFVSIGGKDYKFPGSKQRAVVARLLQAFEARTPRCSTADVLFDAGFKDSVNTLAKAFSGRDDWKEFMAEANGMSWAFV